MVSLTRFVHTTFFFWFFIAHFRVVDAHGNHSSHVCGTPDFDPALMKRIMDIKTKQKLKFQSKVLPSIVTVDTYFCVVTDGFGRGDVDDSVLEKQIAVLNESFANSSARFRFKLKGRAERFVLEGSLSSQIPLLDYIVNLTGACRQGGMDALNVFVVPYFQEGGGYGFAYPFFFTGSSYIDGVYVLPSTLPGGGLPALDFGITVVHEVGHWLGLIHPFQANPPYDVNPCNPANPNDYIADTPQMSRPTEEGIGCPVNQNTCPLLSGLDPTNNFMDYGDDYDSKGNVCKTMFTAQQVARMDDVWEAFRIQNNICATNEFQFDLQIKFDQSPNSISWDIKLRNGTIIHQSITYGLGDPYEDFFAGQTITISKCFDRKKTYIFTIYSVTGKGIKSPGFYRIYIDKKKIAQGGQDFTTSKSIPFGAAATPTRKPTLKPTAKPVARPPTAKPTTRAPTAKTTARPTAKPAARPTVKPTLRPTVKPTVRPTAKPTARPTAKPIARPTAKPIARPTAKPTARRPTAQPTARLPTAKPIARPPTAKPTARPPTAKPTARPTVKPIARPTVKPTVRPTAKPIARPTAKPIARPTAKPTARRPTAKPTAR